MNHLSRKIITSALSSHELELYYQPQVNCMDGKVVGLEALLHWHSPKFGKVSPCAVFSILENSSSVIQVNKWIIQSVCEQYEIWQKTRVIEMPIAINISSYHLEQDNLLHTVISALEQYNLSPSCIEIEITERTPILDREKVIRTLKSLREIGIRIAIDDFGSEYCTFSYVKDLPIDIVKIDKSFIDDIGYNARSEAIIKSTVSLVLSFGMLPIAEGVELKSQIEFLTSIGCATIQGFYYYKPMRACEIEQILPSRSDVLESGVFSLV